MYARSTTFQARPSNIDQGITYIRDEVMPALHAMGGCIGLSLLVDRDSGQCIATSAWDDEDAMTTSAEQAAPLRERAGEIFGGGISVDEWQIGILHRDHHSTDGACVRATWLKVPRDRAGLAIDFYRNEVLPSLDHLEGFCSASLLINRATGRAVSSTSFDSRDAMHRNREQATELRNARTRDLGADVLDVGEFDLALAHLRVPEMV